MEGSAAPDEEITTIRRLVCDVILRALEGFAAEMDRGEVSMRSGPDALRAFHLLLETTLQAHEDRGQ